jgi:hypothetical protein
VRFRQSPARWRSLIKDRSAITLPQRGQYVYGLLAGRLRGLLAYQGVCDLSCRHWLASPPHYVHGGCADSVRKPSLDQSRCPNRVQKRHFERAPVTSDLPLRTDIGSTGRHVLKVPMNEPALAGGRWPGGRAYCIQRSNYLIERR